MIKYKDALTVVVIVIALITGLVGIAMISNTLAPELLDDTIRDITYLEDFESPDVNETNPDGLSSGGTSIYTYAETDWILANVTDLYGAGTSSQSYWVNDSDGDGCYSTFTFASDTYTSASFYFMMNDAYHKMVNVSLEAADGSDLLRFNISDTEVSCHDATEELWDEDITSGVWYKISVALNWEGTFTASLYSVSIAGTLTPVGSGGTGDMGTGAVSYGSCAIFNVSGDVGSDAVVYIDNVQLYKAGADADIDNLEDSYLLVAGVIIFIVVISALLWIFTELKKYKK